MGSFYLHEGLTRRIIQLYYKVYNELGFGFLEKVYENALLHELKCNGFNCKIKVRYRGVKVGVYYADILINDCIIIELKAAESLCEEHELQLINYLKATDIEVGLLLNFGKRPQIKRKIFSNISV